MRACSVDGCHGAHYARGFCNNHYMNWRRNGHPNPVATPAGVPMQYLLAHMQDDCPKWPFARMSNGYAVIRVDGKLKLAHRIVCEIANGPPPSPLHEAAHGCGKGNLGCFGAGCLSWKTRKENDDDKRVHETLSRGEQCTWSKLTESDVHAIRAVGGQMGQKDIAARYGVCRQTVGDILTGRNWSHLNAIMSEPGAEQPAEEAE